MKRKRPPRRMLYYEHKAFRAGYSLIAGVDEAGRGPLAGPVVSAAVILTDFDFKNRIDDSKKLTPRSRLLAYEEIVEKALYGIGIADEKIIDKINIYNATIMAMERAIKGLEREPDFLLIDGHVRLNAPYKRVYIKKGDAKSLSIACASIIAKVTRDRLMENYDKSFPQYGFKKHKGYGTRHHFKAIAKYGPCPIHRFSFRPLKSSL